MLFAAFTIFFLYKKNFKKSLIRIQGFLPQKRIAKAILLQLGDKNLFN